MDVDESMKNQQVDPEPNDTEDEPQIQRVEEDDVEKMDVDKPHSMTDVFFLSLSLFFSSLKF